MYEKVNSFLKITLELNVKSSSLFSKYEVKTSSSIIFKRKV